MQLFRGELRNSDPIPNAILTHLGTFRAATQRAGGLFLNKVPVEFDGQILKLLDFTKNYGVGEISAADFLNQFITHMQAFMIRGYEVDIRNPMRLVDCWEDDPIGSGGMDIFGTPDRLMPWHRKGLKNIFAPFSGVIYPQEVHNKLSQPQFYRLIQQADKDPLFSIEMEKRRNRSIAIREDFEIAQIHEAVWVAKTLDLRRWALKEKFDSFVYANTEEDKGHDSFVTLKRDQIIVKTICSAFDFAKYKELVVPDFLDTVKQKHRAAVSSGNPNASIEILWGNHQAEHFWKPAL